MKKYLVILLSIAFNYTIGFTQTSTITVNGIQLQTEIRSHESSERSSTTDTLVEFYRLTNGEREEVFTFYIHAEAADCNNEFIDKGEYKVYKDSIVFRTDYHQKTGMDPIPDGSIQVYKFDDQGKWVLVREEVIE
jgi:hypothetical protein